jgi:hypothetical protein
MQDGDSRQADPDERDEGRSGRLEDRIDDRSGYPLRTLRVVLGLGVPLALGVVLGFGVLVGFVLQVVDLGRVQRIVEIARYLDSHEHKSPWVALIGNSMMREGLDGGSIVRAANGLTEAANLSLGGFDLNEHVILLPKLLERQPDGVVIGLAPTTVCIYGEFPLDKAYAYAYAGFIESWSQQPQPDVFSGMRTAAIEALRSNRVEQQLHFRTALLTSMEFHLRVGVRDDLRDVRRDFVRPYEYQLPIWGEALESHRRFVENSFLKCVKGDFAKGVDIFTGLLGEVRDAGALPIVLVIPVHPLIRAEAYPMLDRVLPSVTAALERTGGVLIDARGLLSENEFIDVVHPNAEGRSLLSDLVGRKLPSL